MYMKTEIGSKDNNIPIIALIHLMQAASPKLKIEHPTSAGENSALLT